LNAGVEIIIPAPGKKFHMRGNVFIKRNNPENPIVNEKIKEDFMDMQIEKEKEKPSAPTKSVSTLA